jgi:hypothetical protein
LADFWIVFTGKAAIGDVERAGTTEHSVAQQSGDGNATQRQAPLRYSLPDVAYGAAGEGEKKI